MSNTLSVIETNAKIYADIDVLQPKINNIEYADESMD